MARSYAMDLRVRVIDAVVKGASRRAAAERFEVSVSTAIKWVARFTASGDLSARAQCGNRRSKLEPHRDLIFEHVAVHPDQTLQEIRTALAAREIDVALSTRHEFLRRHHITLKKRRFRRPNRIAPTWPPNATTGSSTGPASIPTT